MKSPKMLKHAENWYVLWEIEFDPHTGCTSVRPSPAAWHALVLLPKRDECRRDASPANLKSQVVSVVIYDSWHFLNISSNFLKCLSTYMIMYVPCFLPFESRPGGLCARIAFSLPWLGDERHAKDHRRLRNSQRSSFRHTSSSKYPWGGTFLDQIWERFNIQFAEIKQNSRSFVLHDQCDFENFEFKCHVLQRTIKWRDDIDSINPSRLGKKALSSAFCFGPVQNRHLAVILWQQGATDK